MKKIVLLTAALIMTASMAYAGSSLISGTKHNLSTGNPNSANVNGSTDQVCIFCHTPHNAVRNVPLWNRNNPAAGNFKMYTASATLNFTKAQAGFNADSISLFCLSCHDGATSLGGNVVKYGTTAITTSGTHVAATGELNGTSNANLGIDLTNDHPVAFDYTQSAAGDAGIQPINATRVDQSGTAKFPLFKAGAKSYQLECASCHKVHDDTNTPFLRTTQTGSALCYACHIK